MHARRVHPARTWPRRWAAGALGALALPLAGLVAVAPASAAPAMDQPSALRQSCAQGRPGEVACLSVWRPAGSGAAPAAGSAESVGSLAAAIPPPPSGWRPADIRSAYQLDTTRGAGQVIAIVDAFDNPKAEQDLAAYRAVFGLPPCTTANGCFRKRNQRGGTTPPAGDPGWGVEIALDIQAVSAACPKCKILLVEADTPSVANMGEAVNTAVRLGADVVSNSYGLAEFSGILTLGSRYYTHPGVPIVVSSGDSGYGPASFPAVLRTSIAVGGTRLTRTTTGGWRERAWTGAGSGCSTIVAKPSWQKDTKCAKRTVADLAAVADPNPGFAVYDTYGLGPDSGWITVGGTSLAAPLVAGMIGLAGDADTIDDASSIYAATTGLKDVVAGSNGSCGGTYLCTAVVGYDGPTGRGVPRGLAAL